MSSPSWKKSLTLQSTWKVQLLFFEFRALAFGFCLSVFHCCNYVQSLISISLGRFVSNHWFVRDIYPLLSPLMLPKQSTNVWNEHTKRHACSKQQQQKQNVEWYYKKFIFAHVAVTSIYLNHLFQAQPFSFRQPHLRCVRNEERVAFSVRKMKKRRKKITENNMKICVSHQRQQHVDQVIRYVVPSYLPCNVETSRRNSSSSSSPSPVGFFM